MSEQGVRGVPGARHGTGRWGRTCVFGHPWQIVTPTRAIPVKIGCAASGTAGETPEAWHGALGAHVRVRPSVADCNADASHPRHRYLIVQRHTDRLCGLGHRWRDASAPCARGPVGPIRGRLQPNGTQGPASRSSALIPLAERGVDGAALHGGLDDGEVRLDGVDLGLVVEVLGVVLRGRNEGGDGAVLVRPDHRAAESAPTTDAEPASMSGLAASSTAAVESARDARDR
eukprot:CAMPEP_0206030054 /NCGR_PEP_ID=MMETSP1464-20131121/47323_1 /ASSEMBLY_ACC=CAM_ASM_001124 /TAXON_ID=119497 /ORGANISM="Exanthemachrysis gayraliae, Strain RCC1523" /LENGTH=229 /DNA_ID=CAMNT_0053404153 /DNA_START=285 /DNA_END=972 /DNA_ORIENTATION=-